jgi:hypothetical protein
MLSAPSSAAFGWTGLMGYLLITEGALAHRSAMPRGLADSAAA